MHIGRSRLGDLIRPTYVALTPLPSSTLVTGFEPTTSRFQSRKKLAHDPFEIFHDPLSGRDPLVEKHCTRPQLSFTVFNKLLHELSLTFLTKNIRFDCGTR